MKNILSAAFFLFSALINIGASQNIVNEKPVNVGVINNPPFAIHNTLDNTWEGLGVDLFIKIAQDIGLSYTFTEIKDSSSINLKNIRDEYDFIIGNIPYCPELSTHFHLSIPYYIKGYSILVRNESNLKTMIYTIIDNIFSTNFFWVTVSFLLIVLTFGFFMWLFERNHNKSVSKKMFPGIFNSTCSGIFAFTGVGWEDMCPQTRKGLITATLFAIFSVLVVSNGVSVVTSLLTRHIMKSDLEDFNDLRKMRVGAVLDDDGHLSSFLDQYYFRYTPIKTFEEGINLLEAKKIDAIIGSAPVIEYYVKQNPQPNFKISMLNMGINYYGFLVNPRNPGLRTINSKILTLTNQDFWRKALFKYGDDGFKSPS